MCGLVSSNQINNMPDILKKQPFDRMSGVGYIGVDVVKKKNKNKGCNGLSVF